MAVELNHTIIWCRDQKKSAAFFAEILGRPAPKQFARFDVVAFDNGVSLDFLEIDGKVTMQHYAFLISEAEFDQIFARIKARDLDYWADPGKQKIRQISHNDGGRGFYFEDPDGHFLEVLTRPYGSGG
jgi:catechol 2,3-dioxygenase-like lactoylglutathione lyase family enzyme